MSYHFSNQKSYENVVLLLRRHPLILIGTLLLFFLLGLLPIIVYSVTNSFSFFDQNAKNGFLFLSSIYYLVLLYSLFYNLTDYALDVWIVTDHRIIDMKQNGLFSRDESEARLSNVQDVTVITSGILATLFSFGDVTIQTAAARIEFEFQQIPNQIRVKAIILKLSEEFNRQHINGQEIHDIH